VRAKRAGFGLGGWNALEACASGRSMDLRHSIATMVPCYGFETCIFGELKQAHLVLVGAAIAPLCDVYT